MRAGPRVSLASRAARREGSVRRLRGREDAVSFALLVQLIACLGSPALHLLDHRADHQHLADGTVRLLAHGARGHAALPLPLPLPACQTAPGCDRQDSPPLIPHGAGAVQHFGLALAAPGAVHVALPVGCADAPVIASLDSFVRIGVALGCARPRGPPSPG
jgi:hypothetical protein